MRAVRSRVPLLARHLARLRIGASLLDLPIPPVDLEAAIAGLLAANGLAEAGLRLTLTRGPGPRGLLPPVAPTPTLLLACSPLPSPPVPARAIVAIVTRRNELSPLSRIKALGYLDQLLALQEARARGCEEALLLNTQGRLACATAANLFLVRDGALITPPPGEGALPGITRGLVIEQAPSLGIGVREELLGPAALDRADEVFLTSSLRLVTPVAAIGGRALPAPGRVTGAITAALQRAAAA